MILVCPAFAAEDTFVPSISYKDGPEIDDAEMGNEDVDVCLVITSLKAAVEKTTDVSQESRDFLLEVYEKLTTGEMKLPTGEGFVIRELVDVSWEQVGCVEQEHTHEGDLNKEGITVTMDLNLGVDANTDVLVYAYHNGQWDPIKSAKNNGDGTVTCVFEHFCPVAFAVREQTGGSETGDTARTGLVLYGVLMAVSTLAIVALVIYRKKHTR
jgi:hypothetical protein